MAPKSASAEDFSTSPTPQANAPATVSANAVASASAVDPVASHVHLSSDVSTAAPINSPPITASVSAPRRRGRPATVDPSASAADPSARTRRR